MTCENCFYIFGSNTFGECDNRHSSRCGQKVFYDTPACEHYLKMTISDEDARLEYDSFRAQYGMQ